MMERVLYLVVAVAALTLPPAVKAQITQAAANTNLTFDVASVKPSRPDEVGIHTQWNRGNFKITNASLKFLVMNAYDLHDL